jgi:negative regulator of sigma E activity
MRSLLATLLRDECGGVTLKALAVAASVFGASVFGLGRFVEQARAQTSLQTTISLTQPLPELRLSAAARSEVETALRAMSDDDLAMTYARIFATFRDYVGQDDLSVARALVDYAALAEAELSRRGLARPANTHAAAQMLQTWELVL